MSKSDSYRRQILTFKESPRAEIKIVLAIPALSSLKIETNNSTVQGFTLQTDQAMSRFILTTSSVWMIR